MLSKSNIHSSRRTKRSAVKRRVASMAASMDAPIDALIAAPLDAPMAAPMAASKAMNVEFEAIPLEDVGKAPTAFPPPALIVQYPISNATLTGFKRIKDSPMDCAINALQIMGVITPKVGNLLRVTSIGKVYGLTESEIAKIFILHDGYNYLFAATSSFDEFAAKIKETLEHGHVCFAGYTHPEGGGHVIVIGRQLDGKIVLIDPQQDLYCELEKAACAAYISGKSSYHLLFRSTEKLSAEQLATLGEGFEV